MIELQIISKILEESSTDIITSYNLDLSHFHVYKDEMEFIIKHQYEWGNVPDKATFLSNFPDIDFVGTNESNEYLVNTLLEEHTYSLASPVINKVAELMQTDSREAISYMMEQAKILNEHNRNKAVDIVSQANIRYSEYQEMKANPNKLRIETGFKEIDDLNGGWSRGEELILLFAKSGQGKSWVAIKMLQHAWKIGERVGLIEPEMSASKTGYRFDTLNGNMSNYSVSRGKDAEGYDEYIAQLQTKSTPFFVATPKDFDRKITISKLRTFCQTNKLDILGIDGVGYLTDERAGRGTNRTTELTHIAEDLMDLSIELKIPILMIYQSNRGVEKGADLELDNVRDSDGLVHNASEVWFVKQFDENCLRLGNLKSRNSKAGAKLDYTWDIDTGKFAYISNSTDNYSTQESRRATREEFKDNGDF